MLQPIVPEPTVEIVNVLRLLLAVELPSVTDVPESMTVNPVTSEA
jgi:hypothetical protein